MFVPPCIAVFVHPCIAVFVPPCIAVFVPPCIAVFVPPCIAVFVPPCRAYNMNQLTTGQVTSLLSLAGEVGVATNTLHQQDVIERGR